jgi:hypothetical protein
MTLYDGDSGEEIPGTRTDFDILEKVQAFFYRLGVFLHFDGKNSWPKKFD